MYVSPLNRSLLQGHPEALGSVQIEHVTPKRDGFTHQKIGDCPIQHLNQYPYVYRYIYREREGYKYRSDVYIPTYLCAFTHIYIYTVYINIVTCIH